MKLISFRKLNKSKINFILFSALTFSLIYFLTQFNIINSSEEQDFSVYIANASQYTADVKLSNLYGDFSFANINKLLWNLFLYSYIKFTSNYNSEVTDLPFLKFLLSSLLVIAICKQRNNNITILFPLVIISLISFETFNYLFTEWLRTTIALIFSLFSLIFYKDKYFKNKNYNFFILLGIVSFLFHFSLLPTFFCLFLSLKSKVFSNLLYSFSLPILFLAYPNLFFFNGFQNNIFYSTLLITIFIFILLYYKGKNSIFTFNIFSSYCIPFIYFVAIDSQNFQRCSGLLSVFILLFAYDLIISLLNEFLKVKPKPIIK